MPSGLYRGRLRRGPSPTALRFVSSLEQDLAFLDEELEATRAHIVMLCEGGLLTRQEAGALLKALEAARGSARRARGYEDIHELVEAEVTKRAGEVGLKLHMARSRNDQAATITRMKARRELLRLASLCCSLCSTLLRLGKRHARLPLIYYTHLRPAQLGSLGHYFLAQAEALLRDVERALEGYERANLCPLGAAACAGTSLPIDRRRTAQLLGFHGPLANSLDAVTSRDFVLDALHAAACTLVDLARLAEDLALWGGPEFGLLELGEATSFSSSIMPQKKNPDVLELIRAKCALISGLYSSLAGLLKGLPSGYNRDLQEVKPLLAGLREAQRALSVMSEVLRGVRPHDGLERRARASEALAPELVEWLTLQGVPFRRAYSLVAELMRELASRGRGFASLGDEEMKWLLREAQLPERLLSELRRALEPGSALARRRSEGSPNPAEVDRLARALRARLRELLRSVKGRQEQEARARLALEMEARALLQA